MYQSLSVIIPCYNEESVIQKTFLRVKAVLEKVPFDSEVIFINDGSSDKTEEILQKIAEENSFVNIISFSRNFGHQNAVTAGINNCQSDLAVILDADLQDPPELIPEMIDCLLKNQAQVVYGVRKIRKGESFFKKLTAKYFYRLINFLSETKLPVDTGDFRLIDKTIIHEFNTLKEKGKYIRGLITWVGFKQVPFYYEREPRFAGETKYPLLKMLKFAFSSMIYFSKKPLQIATTLGFISILVSIGLVVWSILGKVLGFTHAISGWTSLFVVIIFFSGVQLLTIGLVGTYLGSLFDEIKNRPEYIIKSRTKEKAED